MRKLADFVALLKYRLLHRTRWLHELAMPIVEPYTTDALAAFEVLGFGEAVGVRFVILSPIEMNVKLDVIK